jgi:succinate dehydrogenase / fumarate reductase, cytochrome b subunit
MAIKSPHLSIYKIQLTSFMSILHRMAGLFLLLDVFYLVAFIFCMAQGIQVYETFLYFSTSLWGKILIFLGIISFYYHYINGIRYFLWSFVMCIEIKQVYLSGRIVLLIFSLLSFVTFKFIFF